MEAGTKLLLSPGIAQIYYGDESDRSLVIEGTNGDATLRSFMNWDAINTDAKTQKTLLHWQKLGQFRKNHPAVGAGIHKEISVKPYVFSREYSIGSYTDNVVIGLDLPIGKKEISVGTVFKNGDMVKDVYSGNIAIVENNKVSIDSKFDIILLELNN